MEFSFSACNASKSRGDQECWVAETSFSYTATLVLNAFTRLLVSPFSSLAVYFSSLFTTKTTNTSSPRIVPSFVGMSAGKIFRRQWPLSVFLIICLLCLVSPCKSDELKSLMKLKATLQQSKTNVFGTWNIAENYSTCNFTGVVCNPDGLVKEIQLSQQNLVGIIPFDAICELQSLEKLSLGSNFLYGSVSEDLNNCSRLQYLDLGSNSFTGKVPDFSSLSKLKFLNLNASGFSGQFPWKSLENLTQLTSLSLGDNLFDRNPFPLELLKLDKLSRLYLTNSSLQGQIPPGIGNLTQLENLELAYNQLSGEIPASISNLQKLWQLELYENQFSGRIPVGFGNLTNLVNFDASTNFLEGDLSELKSLTKLASLQLFENQFSGEVPEELGDFKQLVQFSLYTNNFTGSLPQKLGSWADFNYIDVSENQFSGPIPPDMCKNGKMTDLLILQNQFTGTIPENYANCLSLVRLRANHNSLSGTIAAGIWSLPSLVIIDLTFNQFEGAITSDFGNAKSLAQIFLANNRFGGELPLAISKAASLVAINLSSNQFSGEIPTTIGDLKKLSSLHMENNMFSGSIPDSIGLCTSLSDVNLAGNLISGDIPASIGSLPNLNSMNLSDNKLCGKIPTTLSSLKLSLLDLSNNLLIGRIPDSLSIEAYNSSFGGNVGLCSEKIKQVRPCSSDSGGKSGNLLVVMSCLIGVVSVLLVTFACLIFIKLKRRNQDGPIESGSWDLKRYRELTFTESEIINRIKHENMIGKGASGNVYRVVLDNGQELAVKHVWKSISGQRRYCRDTAALLKMKKFRSPEYDAEVATLSSIRHVNVVKLYCSITSDDSDLLVYEYMSNGSLWDCLHTSRKMEMPWELRYEIAIGAARGLEYLHHWCNRPVIHRDVKSSNILLDENLNPRIADFGLAKIVGGNKNWDSSAHVVAGTHGYIAPEYAYTNKINEKSDVYSFGVVLMELVTGRQPVELDFGESKDIVNWISSKVRTRDGMFEVVDSTISNLQKEDAIKVLRIAIHCTSRVPALRPSMRAVVQMLEEAKPGGSLTKIVIEKDGRNA